MICPGDTGSLVSKLINQMSSPSLGIVGYSLDCVWLAIYYKRVKLYQLIRITDRNSLPLLNAHHPTMTPSSHSFPLVYFSHGVQKFKIGLPS